MRRRPDRTNTPTNPRNDDCRGINCHPDRVAEGWAAAELADAEGQAGHIPDDLGDTPVSVLVLVRTVIRVCVPIEARPSLAPVMTRSRRIFLLMKFP
jgi:hypothetical protein